MKKHHINHLWLVLGAYGAWFALLSGLEEVAIGKMWKFLASLVLGIVSYIIIENRLKK